MRPLSARNPRLARLSRLVRKRGERVDQRALVVEGPVLLGAALDAGLVVREAFVDEGQAEHPAVVEALARLADADGPEPWLVPAGVLDRVGDVVASQGLIAEVAAPDPAWPTPATAPFVLVLAGLQIPGNVGTLVRAAAAAGAGAVLVVGGADPTSPKALRASAGAAFHVDVVARPANDPDAAALEALRRLQADGYRVAAAVVRDGEAHTTAALGEPVAVVLGSEAHGLPAAVADAADERVTIEMAGPTESLNVAMAGTLLCFEVLRRR